MNTRAKRPVSIGGQADGLHKASGLELEKPQGAQAVGLCGLGEWARYRMGLEEGHSLPSFVAPKGPERG